MTRDGIFKFLNWVSLSQTTKIVSYTKGQGLLKPIGCGQCIGGESNFVINFQNFLVFAAVVFSLNQNSLGRGFDDQKNYPRALSYRDKFVGRVRRTYHSFSGFC